MEIKCKMCGAAIVTVDMPQETVNPEIRKSLLSIITRGAVCDECYERDVAPMLNAEKLEQRRAALQDIFPTEFAATDWAHPTMQSQAIKDVLAWKFGARGMILLGPTGRGKSRSAYHVLKREHMAGRSCVQYSHSEWAMKFYGASSYEVMQTCIGEAKGCDLMLIDDLGKARIATNDHEATKATELLFDVFDHRTKWRRPLIITTRMRATDFSDKWGEHGKAMARRIADYCAIIKF